MKLACALAGFLASSLLATAIESAEVKALFRKPSRDYSNGPLWVWNDLLTEQQIRETLRDLASQKVKQAWVHPRPGLMTPYLSPDWFRLWKVALKEAERLDMNIWIYDENSYPSGFAGGLVPEQMPESRGRGLAFREEKTAPKWSDALVGVYRLEGGSSENVTAALQSGATLPEGQYLVVSQVRAKNDPWHGDRCYVNLLSPGVTEKFLELTLEPYRCEIGKQFGKRVPGVFTDEPNIRPAGNLPWSETLIQDFQKRWGYNLLDHLPSLMRPVGDWRKIRHNYFQLLNEQFIEHWARPYHDYCETNHLEWTGHYWDHDWPSCIGVPDNMAMYAWHQRPAIDCLMNQYAEHTHAQFGNARMVRELSSIANQLGMKRTLCETYGAGGWDLRFEDMKRIGDWLQVLGVNTINEHLSYVTLRGARKRDHPQSFSYHEPWWEAYHVVADYFARLSAALSQGEQINRVLVLEPTTTAWTYQNDNTRLDELGNSFFQFLMSLEAAQIEYDLGCEDVLARHGSVEAGGLKVGRRLYQTVVLPLWAENLNASTAKLLAEFMRSGGTVLSCGEPPSRTDGSLSPEGATLAKSERWKRVDGSSVAAQLTSPGFQVTRQKDDHGILFHHRRQLADGQLLFLVNTSIESASSGTLHAEAAGVEQWDLASGATAPYPCEPDGAGVRAAFELPPSGSLLLFLSENRTGATSRSARAGERAGSLPPGGTGKDELNRAWVSLQPTAPPTIRRLAPNVLTLDYVDVTAGGETKKNIYFYKANQFAWKKNGLERDPWDSAVQFKDELISKRFPPDSGFEASYKFVIDGAVPKDLAIVIERPDLYRITCNGQPLKAKRNDWWLDKVFGRIAIGSVACCGENVVTIKASPFTMFHELEPAYVLGSFTVQPAARGFVIAPDQPLRLGTATTTITHSVNPDGTMWLSRGVGFDRNAPDNNDRAPFLIFDLGRLARLSAIDIWNYNENHVRDLTSRGVAKLRITGAMANEPDAYKVEIGTFTLARASGAAAPPERINVSADPVRFVRFDILSNQNGVSYPAEGEPDDNGFVGLAEVRFFSGAAQVDPVKVLRISSELASHDRQARYLVDGSGLNSQRAGWNLQGHPFYSAGVAYIEQFTVAQPRGQFRVVLPGWYGSVARVSVNGKMAGWISAPPWECDASQWVRQGQNEIEVTVIGTLKNTLGPHHGNPKLGAAWPAAFHQAPDPGPPPGANYSTVAYGLFEPFVLKQARTD